MQIIGMLLGTCRLNLFYHGADQAIPDCGGGSRDHRDCHLWYLDLHLGLDECQQPEHQKHHDNLDAIVGGVPRVQSDVRFVLRGDNDADKHSLTFVDLATLRGAGDLQPAQRSSIHLRLSQSTEFSN